jgi:hypothetical protein
MLQIEPRAGGAWAVAQRRPVISERTLEGWQTSYPMHQRL